MRLSHLHIVNFRGLERITVEFDNRVNVIVGPNAIGKTTILEAIRLVKALLAPRTGNESQQAMISLRLAVPHYPQRIFPSAIARNANQRVEVHCRYELSDAELERIGKSIPEISTELVLGQLGRSFANSATSMGFLSSPQGQAALKDAKTQVATAVDELRKKNRTCNLEIGLDPAGTLSGGDPVSAAMVSFLDQSLPPNLAIFSYFPADRALPFGEIPVQLGIADAAQQIESYTSQPQLKYQRLKNTIFNAFITSEQERNALLKEFSQIFEGILRGRKFQAVGIDQHGLLSIQVKDTETGRLFDLDGMSSGEKGLVLTFLLIGRSIAPGGLILIDEPELHLNPAVCRNILNFLVDKYVLPHDLQVIICSHSPEILAGAFDRNECSLFHLASETLLTKVRPKDNDEITQALRRLGTSESEGLLYRATIFVEGEEDVDVIEAGFGDLLRRYKLKDLGGRNEVEKQIQLLQEAEKKKVTLPPCYFIFDRDTKATELSSSAKVKILQWQRRCLENYLIDIDTLTDILQDDDIVRQRVSSIGEVNQILRGLALAQLDDLCAKEAYSEYHFDDAGMRSSEVQGKNIGQISEILFNRLKIMHQQTSVVTEDWKTTFTLKAQQRKDSLLSLWEVKWMEHCDGKRLFRDLHRKIAFRISSRRLKKRLIQEMSRKQTENWRALQSLLTNLISEEALSE